jgi:hypothetical protein
VSFTRIVASVAPTDLLPCTHCGSSKPAAAGFHIKRDKRPGRRDAYANQCKVCQNSHVHQSEKPVKVQVHTGRSGRPDFFMQGTTLHMDLPGEGGASRARPQRPQRAQSPERDLMLRMEPRLRSLMRDGDLGEAKAGIGRQQIVTGVGQLRLKRFENGKGRMFLVLPTRPPKPICDWVTDEGISLVIEKEVTNG